MASQKERRKKEAEELYLQRFLSLAEWGVSDVIAGEHPDFVVRVGQHRVGVELTELLKDRDPKRGSSSKRSEGLHTRFLRDLARAFYDAGGGPSRVRVLLANHKLPSIATASRALLQARRGLSDWASVRLQLGDDGVHYMTALPEQVGQYKSWVCVSDSVGWVGAISERQLTTTIRGKAAKLTGYRSGVDRAVLLIVADQTTNAGRWRLARSFVPVNANGFDEVHLLTFPLETRRIDRGAAF